MAEETPTLNLNILSPSTEVEGGVSFAHVPTSTTIKELRSRIQNAVPSKPAPERMRLIYRGRVVANDADTLGHVFGADNIRENKDQSLHLVLRELPPTSGTASSSPAPRSSTAPPNPFRPAQVPLPASPLQTNPFRTLPQPRPNSQPQIPQPHHHHHPHNHPHPHHHHHLSGPANPFPIPLPPPLQQQLAQAIAQNGQPHAQAPSTQGQQSSGATPSPGGGAQAPLPGAGQAPPMGFGASFPSPNGGRTVRQEGIGPNGERWSVTYNSINLPARPQQPILPQPFLPPAFGLPPLPGGPPAPADVIDRLLPRVRAVLQSARQEMENVRTLSQMPGAQQETPASRLGPPNHPNWRVERIQEHLQNMGRNLDLVERGVAVVLADASLAQNPEVAVIRQSANELRAHAEEMNRMLLREQSNTIPARPSSSSSTTGPPSSAAPATPTSSGVTLPQPQSQSTTQTVPTDSPPELFILSSPQGPVGVLFDQRGTYTTAPMVSTLPFQTFTNQFAQNRQLIAGLGQQIAQGSGQLHNQLANIQPTPTQPPAPGGQALNQAGNQAQNQVQNQNHNHNQHQNVNRNANPPAENDRMVNVAGHLWLIFKLACFVYFFSGGSGSVYRPILIGVIAAVVYLAQIGIFEEQFNLVRRHFEALLPVGALADRAAQPRNPNNQAQHQQRADPIRNLTPQQAAQRLLQQRREQRGWLTESFRTVERAFALFLASLWPGIGERMVHAQEERLRLERVAEEEERQRQEEARRQEAEAQQQGEEKKESEGERGDVESSSGSAKGKQKADVVEDEASGSSGQAL